MTAARVTIVEVGPRDGLQNERATVATADKIEFVNRLSHAGLPVIEVSAFVSPKWVPQMADAADVFAGIARRAGTRYTALVPNLPGLERAQAARVGDIAARLIGMGVYEVAVSDTIGIAHPGQVPRVLDAVLARVPVHRLALHFHDTRGTALANVLAALPYGITTFDASAGGLGGCPYAPGAAGNLATDDLIYMLDGLGIETGVSLTALTEASSFIASKIDHRLPSRYAQATLHM